MCRARAVELGFNNFEVTEKGLPDKSEPDKRWATVTQRSIKSRF